MGKVGTGQSVVQKTRFNRPANLPQNKRPVKRQPQSTSTSSLAQDFSDLNLHNLNRPGQNPTTILFGAGSQASSSSEVLTAGSNTGPSSRGRGRSRTAKTARRGGAVGKTPSGQQGPFGVKIGDTSIPSGNGFSGFEEFNKGGDEWKNWPSAGTMVFTTLRQNMEGLNLGGESCGVSGDGVGSKGGDVSAGFGKEGMGSCFTVGSVHVKTPNQGDRFGSRENVASGSTSAKKRLSSDLGQGDNPESDQQGSKGGRSSISKLTSGDVSGVAFTMGVPYEASPSKLRSCQSAKTARNSGHLGQGKGPDRRSSEMHRQSIDDMEVPLAAGIDGIDLNEKSKQDGTSQKGKTGSRKATTMLFGSGKAHAADPEGQPGSSTLPRNEKTTRKQDMFCFGFEKKARRSVPHKSPEPGCTPEGIPQSRKSPAFRESEGSESGSHGGVKDRLPQNSPNLQPANSRPFLKIVRPPVRNDQSDGVKFAMGDIPIFGSTASKPDVSQESSWKAGEVEGKPHFSLGISRNPKTKPGRRRSARLSQPTKPYVAASLNIPEPVPPPKPAQIPQQFALKQAQARGEHFRNVANDMFTAKKYHDAETIYSDGVTAVEAFEYPELKPLLACLLSNRAASRLMIGEVEKALKDCQEALQAHPEYIKAYVRCATCHLRLGQFQDGQVVIEKAAGMVNARDPHHGRIVSKVSEANAALRNFNETKALLVSTGWTDEKAGDLVSKAQALSAVATDSEHVSGILACALLRVGQYDQAVTHVQKAFKQFDIDNLDGKVQIWWQWILAQAYWQKFGEADIALKETQKILMLMEAYEITETTCSLNAGCKAAREEIEAFLSKMSKVMEHKESGNTQVKKKSYESAIEQYNKALAICGECGAPPHIVAVIHSNRGSAFYGLKKYAEAISDCSRAKALSPGFSRPLSRLAQILSETRQPDAAVSVLQQMRAAQGDDQSTRSRIVEAQVSANSKPTPHHYRILGIKQDSTEAEIRKAYKMLALRLHPDKVAMTCKFSYKLGMSGIDYYNASSTYERVQAEASWIFKSINEALAALTDGNLRHRLNMELEEETHMAGPSQHAYGGRGAPGMHNNFHFSRRGFKSGTGPGRARKSWGQSWEWNRNP